MTSNKLKQRLFELEFTKIQSFELRLVECESSVLKINNNETTGYLSPFIVGSKKQEKKGRKSGGILAYVKPCLRKGITEVKHSNFSIWLKLDHNTLGLKRKIYLGFCYTTPYKKKRHL